MISDPSSITAGAQPDAFRGAAAAPANRRPTARGNRPENNGCHSFADAAEAAAEAVVRPTPTECGPPLSPPETNGAAQQQECRTGSGKPAVDGGAPATDTPGRGADIPQQLPLPTAQLPHRMTHDVHSLPQTPPTHAAAGSQAKGENGTQLLPGRPFDILSVEVLTPSASVELKRTVSGVLPVALRSAATSGDSSETRAGTTGAPPTAQTHRDVDGENASSERLKALVLKLDLARMVLSPLRRGAAGTPGQGGNSAADHRNPGTAGTWGELPAEAELSTGRPASMNAAAGAGGTPPETAAAGRPAAELPAALHYQVQRAGAAPGQDIRMSVESPGLGRLTLQIHSAGGRFAITVLIPSDLNASAETYRRVLAAACRDHGYDVDVDVRSDDDDGKQRGNRRRRGRGYADDEGIELAGKTYPEEAIPAARTVPLKHSTYMLKHGG